jgi:hypothetical protein
MSVGSFVSVHPCSMYTFEICEIAFLVELCLVQSEAVHDIDNGGGGVFEVL